MPEVIDILENELWQQMPEVLRELLRDHTTGRNIFWATGDYEHLGDGYCWKDEIKPERITGEHGSMVMPRVLKSKEQQTDRSKEMAEVFTPVWVVEKMVDYVDIDINTLCLELTCGEAPSWCPATMRPQARLSLSRRASGRDGPEDADGESDAALG